MSISFSVEAADMEFSIIAYIRIVYAENFGIIARGRPRPEERFR
jgi:hypothetical protein